MANEGSVAGKPFTPPPGGEPARFPWKIVIVAVLVLAVISFVAIWRNHPKTADTGMEGKGGGKGGKGAKGGGSGGPVTAVIGTVEQKDFPIYLDGLGTVQAFNTVTVRSR